MPLVFVDSHHQCALRRQMVEWSLEQEKVRAELADRQGHSIDEQMHFHIGGLPGVTC